MKKLFYFILFFPCKTPAQTSISIKAELGKPMIIKDIYFAFNLSITDNDTFSINIPESNTILADKKFYTEFEAGYQLKIAKRRKNQSCLFFADRDIFPKLQRVNSGETKVIRALLPKSCLKSRKKYKITFFLKIRLKGEKGEEDKLVEVQAEPLNFKID